MKKIVALWNRPCLNGGEGDVFTIGNVVCAAIGVCILLAVLGMAGSIDLRP